MRILAVKTHAFGDALLTTPAVAGLVRQGHSVTVLAGPSSLPVWNRFPGLEGVVSSPAPCGITRLFAWSVRNRLKGFDRAVHFGSSPDAKRWVRYLCRCETVSGADPATGFSLLKPAAADYCRIAGTACDDLTPVFPVLQVERDFARKLTGGDAYAVIAPGGGRNPREFVPEKRWPVSRWDRVAAFLIDRGLGVFIIGGGDEASLLSGIPGTLLAGKLTWGQSAALIAGADLFAGNDSGPAHLAVAGRTPALVLFGPTDPESLYVTGSITALRSSSRCSPCYSNSVFQGCREEGSCMEAITVEEVLQTLEGIIAT